MFKKIKYLLHLMHQVVKNRLSKERHMAKNIELSTKEKLGYYSRGVFETCVFSSPMISPSTISLRKKEGYHSKTI